MIAIVVKSFLVTLVVLLVGFTMGVKFAERHHDRLYQLQPQQQVDLRCA